MGRSGRGVPFWSAYAAARANRLRSSLWLIVPHDRPSGRQIATVPGCSSSTTSHSPVGSISRSGLRSSRSTVRYCIGPSGSRSADRNCLRGQRFRFKYKRREMGSTASVLLSAPHALQDGCQSAMVWPSGRSVRFRAAPNWVLCFSVFVVASFVVT